MKNFLRLATLAFLGGAFFSGIQAQVIPTVGITAPATVSTGATFSVSAAAADTSGHLLNLNVTRNGVYWGSAAAIVGDPTRFNLTVSGNDTAPLTPGMISFYAAVTSDASSANTTATVTVVDGTPPSVPVGLNATSITTTGFTLNWTASTDNVAVTGYEVQQDLTSLGTVTVLSKAVSGLTPGLTYAMTVRAKDALTNWSAWSSPLNVTTLKATQAAVTITSGTTGTYGTPYTATASGGNGTGAYVWALGTGSTASNAAIDPSTGVITADSSGTVVINVYRAGDINYNPSAVTANKTVTFAKRTITVTLSGTKVYDTTTAATGASATITSGTLAGSDTIGYVFAATSSANAGTYTGLTTATISNGAAPTTRTTSYTITYAGSYIVTKADQTVLTITSSSAATYGTAYTATATGGAATGALVWTLGAGSTASGAAINSSSGAITTTGSGTVVVNVYRAASTNYNVSPTTADFTVTFAPRPITVTLAGSKTYDGTTASTGASASRTAGTLAGTDTIAFAYAATSSANAGTYTGLATTTISNPVAPLTRTGSYAITNAGVYTINKAAQAAVTITSASTVNYGTAYTATATGGNGTGALVWALGTGSTATGAAIDPGTGAITANSSGTVVIKVYRAADTNYNVSATTANFTVTVAKVPITITLSGTKAYNGTTAATGASAAITSGALVGTDTIGYVFAATSSANAGTYTGLTTATISNTVAPTTRTTSYTITYAGSYTVTKINQAAVTISSSASATYGTAYTATATGGTGTGALVWALGTGSTASSAAINASTGAVTANSNGTVVINVYRAADTNYNVSATTANFTVTFAKRAITVTLSGSKAYDGTTASTGASAAVTAGTLGTADTIGYAFAATSSAAPGTYPGLATATVSNVTAPTNRTGSYTITAAGTYTITKAAQAAVAITSPSSVVYGDAYTATASGGSGTGALVWALGAGSTASGAAVNSSTGMVSFTSSGLVRIKVYRALDANYNQSATTADFTITVAQRPITVTLTGSKTYNGSTASTGASATRTAGTLAGTDTIAFAYAAAGSPNAGSYPGLATATISNTVAPTARSASYAITYAGSYTINPAAATFALNSTSFFYNGSAQGPTVIPTPAGATFTPGGILSATSIGSYIGTATATGNYSGSNNNLTWSIAADTSAPTVPTGLASSNVTLTSFTLTWTASTDNVGVALYTVYQNGVSIGTSATPAFNVTGLTASTTYSMTVKAQDAVPNVSAASAPLAVTTQTDTGGVPTTGLRLWLRADAGLTKDGSNHVTAWADQSSAHNNPTPSGSPVFVAGTMNGQAAVRFNGVSNSLSLPNVMAGATQGELIIVARLADFTKPHNALAHFGGSVGTIYGSTQMWNDFGGNGAPFTPPAAAVLLAPHVFDSSYASDGTHILLFNNVEFFRLTGQGYYFRPNPLIGFDWQNEGFNGDIAEVIVYDHPLSVAEHAALADYLGTKYGVGGPPVPAITSPLTAAGATNTALSPVYAITATNFPTSYNATGLPAGLSVNITTGVISGTPTIPGTSNVTISATNSAGTGSATLVFTISNPAAPVITSALTLSAPANVSLSPTYAITAANIPTSFNALGLPAGLSVNTATGVISGTPTVVGTTSVTISATNAIGTGTATLVITVTNPMVPASGLRLWLRADVGTTLDGNGNVSTWMDQSGLHNDATQGGAGSRPQLVANAMNGQPVLRFDGAGDSFPLPDVMNGALQGEIFIVAKLKDFTNAANGLAHFGGNQGTIYAATQIWNDFGGSDGNPIALSDPSVLTSPHLLDASMALDHTGVVQINGVTISTKPNVGTYFRPNPLLGIDWQNEFFRGDIAEVIVYDHVLTPAERTTVGNYLYVKYAVGTPAIPAITSALTASAMANTLLSPNYTITATNFPTSYSAAGLPPGLFIDTTTGVISGTPTTIGTSSITISATNLAGTGSATLVLTTTTPGPPVITSPLTFSGTTGVVLAPTYIITSTNSPISFGATGLPSGLSVNITTGEISGTPAIGTAGTRNVTISATNVLGTGTATLVMTISSPTVPTSGLRLWLRGDLGTTLDGSGNVSTWVDQSAAHNNATQSATGSRPLLVTNAMNGQPVLRFDGAGDNFALPDVMNGATQGEIFIIAKLKDFTNAANGLVHFGGSTGTIYGSTQIWNDFGGGDGNPITLSNPSVLTSPHLFDASMASDRTGVVQINGVQISSKPNVGTYFRPNPVLGIDWQNEFFKGDIAEVIVFDHVLTTTDHAMVNSYLLSKYGLGTPLITSAATLDATLNTALTPSYTITASGAPTSYNATGLPPGLSVNGTTGVISGTPTALGSTVATISATNAYGTALASLLVTVTPLTPAINSPLTLVGSVGTPLSPTYTITATRTPTSFNAVGLPLGLAVNTSTGLISGTPAAVGASSVTISATNASGTGSATLFITIGPPAPVITSALAASGLVNTVLSPSYTITATNSPTSFNATGLPPGLTINTATGVISGTPTATGVYNVTISATNGGAPGTATLVITIDGVATTFDLSATTFAYTGAPQGPSVVTNPVGATYSTGGTLSATDVGNYTATATANGIYSGTNGSLTWTIVGDSVPPTVPTGLIASNVSSSGFTLSWTAPTDNLAVTGYTIYRDGVSIGTSTTPTFNVTGLTPFTSYNMTVTAQDGAGNTSAPSFIRVVTTLVDSSMVPTTGILLWLRADRGITVDGSGGVQNWVDQTGQGNNATQSTAGNRPQLIANATHSQPVLRFDGVDDYLNTPAFNTGAQQGELFVVVKVPNFATRDDGLWSLGASTGTSTELSGSPRILTDDWGRNTRTQIGAPVTPVADYVIYNVSAVSGDWAIRLNGLMQFHTTTNTLAFGGAGTLGKGTGKFLQGDIAEVLAYDHNMGTAERELIAGYLAKKYAPPGITLPTQPVLNVNIGSTSATLTWNALAGGQHTTTTIERWTGSAGPWVVVAQVDDATTYTDSGLTPGQAYTYRIKVSNYAGVSAYSAGASNDTDGDGVPDAIEVLMGRNPAAGVILDAGNQLHLVIITPIDP